MTKNNDKPILKYATITDDGRILVSNKNKKTINKKALNKAIDNIRDSVIDYVGEPAIR